MYFYPQPQQTSTIHNSTCNSSENPVVSGLAAIQTNNVYQLAG